MLVVKVTLSRVSVRVSVSRSLPNPPVPLAQWREGRIHGADVCRVEQVTYASNLAKHKVAGSTPVTRFVVRRRVRAVRNRTAPHSPTVTAWTPPGAAYRPKSSGP